MSDVDDGVVANIAYDDYKNVFTCTTIEKEGKLIISLPYEDLWVAYVDGVQVPVYKFNMFLSLDIGKGNHEIVVRYDRTAFKACLIISLISVIILIIILNSRKCFTVTIHRQGHLVKQNTKP